MIVVAGYAYRGHLIFSRNEELTFVEICFMMRFSLAGLIVFITVNNSVKCMLLRPTQRFLVINCEDIPWEPISFSDMYEQNLSRDDDSWATCNLALGDALPHDICEYNGVILTGSHYNCRKREKYFQWYEGLMDLVREIAANGKPNLFGGCFGHNLIALALGGTVGFNPNKKYVLQIDRLITNKNFQGMFEAEEKNLYQNVLEEYSIISTHEDCVTELPYTATLLGSTVNCENHFFVAGENQNILALQSHPEFNLQYAVLDRIWIGVVKKRRLLSDEECSFSMKSFENYDDSDAKKMCNVISWFLRTEHANLLQE